MASLLVDGMFSTYTSDIDKNLGVILSLEVSIY